MRCPGNATQESEKEITLWQRQRKRRRGRSKPLWKS
jgi:hypothetical protein